MSERERWIVYPLLFFALGAALRDKLTHRVESKEVYCQTLRIVDPHHPERILAEFGTKQSGDAGNQIPTSFLEVDETKSTLSFTNEIASAKAIRCQNLFVVDPENPQQPTVFVGTGQAPNFQPGQLPRRMGVIQIKDTSDSLLSELRADQFQANRMICKHLSVIAPEEHKPLVQLGTVAMPGISLDEGDAPVSHQGVIVLNNQYFGIQPLRPTQRAPKSTEPQQ